MLNRFVLVLLSFLFLPTTISCMDDPIEMASLSAEIGTECQEICTPIFEQRETCVPRQSCSWSVCWKSYWWGSIPYPCNKCTTVQSCSTTTVPAATTSFWRTVVFPCSLITAPRQKHQAKSGRWFVRREPTHPQMA